MAVQVPAYNDEIRFEVDRDFDPPDLRPLIGRTVRLAEQRFRTVHFDTPDRRLGGRGIALSHRRDEEEPGDAGVWTLSLPTTGGQGGSRPGELRWAGDRQAVPIEIRRIVRGVLRRSELTEVVELLTSRRRLALQGRQQRTNAWGELDDDLITVIGGPRDGLRFRQVRVQLGDERPPAAESVLNSLRRSGAKRGNRPALAIALDEPRRRASRKRPRTLEDALRGSVTANLDQLLDHDYRLRVDPARPEPRHVHRARVAVRRLRSDLKTFGPLLDPVWKRHTTDGLRWIGAALGGVRDADVLALHMEPTGDKPPADRIGYAELQDTVRAERAAAAAALAVALDSDRYLDLLDRLHAASVAPPVLGDLPGSRASTTMPSLVHRRWRSTRRKVARAASRPTDAELHQVRIRAKRLRYASAAAAASIGKRATRTAAAAERLQTVLGDHHDAVVAEQWLRSRLDDQGASPAAVFAAGLLSRHWQGEQERLRRRWRSDWKKLDRRQNRSWMRPGR